jgi:hypothetical protein
LKLNGGDPQKERLKMTKGKKKIYLYSTIKRGKVKVRSAKQHRLLHAKKLPHTHVYRYGNKIIKRRWRA